MHVTQTEASDKEELPSSLWALSNTTLTRKPMFEQ